MESLEALELGQADLAQLGHLSQEADHPDMLQEVVLSTHLLELDLPQDLLAHTVAQPLVGQMDQEVQPLAMEKEVQGKEVPQAMKARTHTQVKTMEIVNPAANITAHHLEAMATETVDRPHTKTVAQRQDLAMVMDMDTLLLHHQLHI